MDTNAAIDVLTKELDDLQFKIEVLPDGNLKEYLNIKKTEIQEAITHINLMIK